MWLDSNSNRVEKEIFVHKVLYKKKPPWDPLTAKLWHYVQENRKDFPDEASLRELLSDSRKIPADPIKARAWDIINSWKYRRAMVSAIVGVPFWTYLAYATSVIAPGYQPMSRVGLWKWISRFFMIGYHPNIWGMVAVFSMLSIFTVPLYYKHRRRKIWPWYGDVT